MGGIWAVAANTIRQALRMKIAAVSVALMAVLLPVMGFSATGDGTVKGIVQSFVSYGFSLASLILCILTMVVSVYSITGDLEQKRLYTVLTKPVSRCRLLLGKLFGVLSLSTALLVIFSALIYGIAVYLPRYHDAGEADLMLLADEFFTARASLSPAEPDVGTEVKRLYRKRLETGQLPPEVLRDGRARQAYISGLAEQAAAWRRAVVPGKELVWQFDNVRPVDPNGSLFIRFKYDVSMNPPDLQVEGRWFAGDNRTYAAGSDGAVYTFERRDLIRTFHEVKVPADAVAADGFLAVGFYNDPRLNDTIIMFPPGEGLEVLYKAGSFTGNFVRAALAVFCRLVFLACLGVFAASFLSFPVAILLCLLIFATGTVSGFCLESFDFLGEAAGRIYYWSVRPLILLLPAFDRFNPAKFLLNARLLGWPLLARAAGIMVCLKASLLLLAGLFIFNRREIARVIV
jgi:hypothetical protein